MSRIKFNATASKADIQQQPTELTRGQDKQTYVVGHGHPVSLNTVRTTFAYRSTEHLGFSQARPENILL